MENQKVGISDEYIRGLIEGEGCFTFCSTPQRVKVNGEIKKCLLPTFVIRMHIRDIELIKAIRDRFRLRNRVYVYRQDPLIMENKRYSRGQTAILIVRDVGALRSAIVPFFYKKLKGHKGAQFMEWLEKIGRDPRVPENYKLIYRLHKTGFWDRYPYKGQD